MNVLYQVKCASNACPRGWGQPAWNGLRVSIPACVTQKLKIDANAAAFARDKMAPSLEFKCPGVQIAALVSDRVFGRTWPSTCFARLLSCSYLHKGGSVSAAVSGPLLAPVGSPTSPIALGEAEPP